jgi:hypothetical protein
MKKKWNRIDKTLDLPFQRNGKSYRVAVGATHNEWGSIVPTYFLLNAQGHIVMCAEEGEVRNLGLSPRWYFENIAMEIQDLPGGGYRRVPQDFETRRVFEAPDPPGRNPSRESLLQLLKTGRNERTNR